MNRMFDEFQQFDFMLNRSSHSINPREENLDEQFFWVDDDGKQWINGFNMKYFGQQKLKIPKPFGKFNGSSEDI